MSDPSAMLDVLKKSKRLVIPLKTSRNRIRSQKLLHLRLLKLHLVRLLHQKMLLQKKLFQKKLLRRPLVNES